MTIATPVDSPPPPAWHRPVAALLLAGAIASGWIGGILGLLGVAAAVVAAALVLRGPGATRITVQAPARGAEGSTRMGAEVMVSQVVPVWSRQMEVTRDAASEGLSSLLQTFSEISDALHTLSSNLQSFNVTAEPGAVDGAVRSESPALQALTTASSRAFAERDAAVAELGRCAEGLAELQQLAKQSRELARHTRLVAFNASIESSRQQHGNAGGTQAVAGELRMLAGRIGETSQKIEGVVGRLSTAIRKARRDGEVGDTSAEELRLEVDLRAREALTALLASLGTSLQGSSEVQQASQTLAAQLEATFMHFQFGDRISQMLSIVANDMSNFARWVAANPRASQSDAAEWLAALEASYTMEEQRSSHHGNVHVEHGSAVEFF